MKKFILLNISINKWLFEIFCTIFLTIAWDLGMGRDHYCMGPGYGTRSRSHGTRVWDAIKIAWDLGMGRDQDRMGPGNF